MLPIDWLAMMEVHAESIISGAWKNKSRLSFLL